MQGFDGEAMDAGTPRGGFRAPQGPPMPPPGRMGSGMNSGMDASPMMGAGMPGPMPGQMLVLAPGTCVSRSGPAVAKLL